jgi:hypothetical protein
MVSQMDFRGKRHARNVNAMTVLTASHRSNQWLLQCKESRGRKTTDSGVTQEPTSRGNCDWVDGWSQAELKVLQQEDPGISVVQAKREATDRKPDRSEVPLVRDDVKAPVGDWELLEVYDGLLYRRWASIVSGTEYNQDHDYETSAQ